MDYKICVYAICKNEEKFVDIWLNSVMEADYIVVLDTGSTDNTYKLLRSDPRITRCEQKEINPWRFDVARNEALKLVPKDADILVSVDLDEVFVPGWTNIIRCFWQDDTERMLYKYAWSSDKDGNPLLVFVYDKIHCNNFHWVFPCHEVLARNGDNALIAEHQNHVKYLDQIILFHYPDQEKSRSNYLSLLQLRYEENPEECYSSYLLGREYLHYNQYDEAIKYFDITLNLKDIQYHKEIEQICLRYKGDCYRGKGELLEALFCYLKYINTDATYIEPYEHIAEIYNQIGMPHIALGYCKQALEKCYRHNDWSEEEKSFKENIWDIMAYSYMLLNDKENAINYCLRALSMAPNDERLLSNYNKLLQL